MIFKIIGVHIGVDLYAETTKEQRDTAVGERVDILIASFRHKAIPP